MRSGIANWFQHPADDRVQRRNEGRAYALFLGNVLLVLIVFICFVFKLQRGQRIYKPHCQNRHCALALHHLPGPSWTVFLLFFVFEFAGVVLYLVNGFWPEDIEGRVETSFQLERENDMEDSTEDDIDEHVAAEEEGATRKGFLIPLSVTVVPNAFAIGYLAYETGGPSNSPYAQVLVAMLVVAQQVKWVRPPKPPDRKIPFVNFVRAIKEYKLFLLVALLFYGPLLTLQAIRPANVSPARPGLSVGVTAVVFLSSTYITYLLDIGGRGG
jgi:hypothetical protein